MPSALRVVRPWDRQAHAEVPCDDHEGLKFHDHRLPIHMLRDGCCDLKHQPMTHLREVLIRALEHPKLRWPLRSLAGVATSLLFRQLVLGAVPFGGVPS